MKKYSLLLMMLISLNLIAQNDSINSNLHNTADILIASETKLTIGGYGQIDYNQALNSDTYHNGNLDVHRLVMLFGYRFNSRTNFVTEIEFEHVKEVYIEQAFLNYKINEYINFRGGLLLIPMGIINEYHEPPTFNGVERPNLDNKIVPTTWREIGAGFTGRFNDIALKYQIYVVNGFNGYDGEANFTGAKGLRSGRQKGAESFMSSPGLSSKIDYYGIRRLKLGFATYFGNSNSTLYDGINKSDTELLLQADSSVVGIKMIGADLRYNYKGFQLRGQYNFIDIEDSDQYNEFLGSDLGCNLSGYYGEIAYNVFRPFNFKTELIPFIRYENYDTHFAVDPLIVKSETYHVEEIIFGLGWKLAKGAVLKADYQMVKSKIDTEYRNQLNIGIGVMF